AQNSPCNVCGAVTIHYRDGREVSYDGNGDAHRMYAEFVSFVNEIASKDTETCYEMLDHSLAVSRILTRARADAGIVFPCDEN
ncbi:MAG: gfo/Idh/MocA family oxidoreductase, partial [Roseburia sp.]